MTTRVVHVNSKEWKNTPENQRVYIGRAMPRREFEGSKWGNPYHIGKMTRQEVIEAYEAELWSTLALANDARRELKDKVLGCWCKPEACHGDVLARIADMSDEEYQEWME